MARNSLKKSQKGSLWLTSYADLVTLMLCFMVLLTSMAVIDERQKHLVLGSVNKTYSASMTLDLPDEPNIMNFTLSRDGMGYASPEGHDFDLLREWVQHDYAGDINFQENRFVQILSLSEALLFAPDTTDLSSEGKEALDRILPLLLKIRYPMLVAGHSAPARDEEASAGDFGKGEMDDLTWLLSYKRAKAVYLYLASMGVPEGQLHIEAFGQHRPRFSIQTAEGRHRNRRVDLVLDKRNEEVADSIRGARVQEEELIDSHQYKGFDFDLIMPGESPMEKHKPWDEKIKDEDLEGAGPVSENHEDEAKSIAPHWSTRGEEGI